MGFIPLFIFWIVNVAISYRLIAEPDKKTAKSKTPKNAIKNSVWLMSFMGVFIPAFFRTSYLQKYDAEFCMRQHRLLRNQCIASIIIYVPSLLACLMIVNLPINFMYGSYITLDNDSFNVCIGLVIFEGIISTLLSFSSKWSGTTNKHNIHKKNRAQGQSKQAKKDQAKSFKSTTLKSTKIISQKYNKVKGGKIDKSKSITAKGARKNRNKKHARGLNSNINIKNRFQEKGLNIIGTLVILSLACLPIYKCFEIVVFSASYKDRSYLYFKGNNTNESILIETIHVSGVNSTSGPERFFSTLFHYGYAKFRNTNAQPKAKVSGPIRFVKNINLRSSFSGDIVVVDSQLWEKRMETNMDVHSNAAAIILLHPPNFRPSSPIQNIPRFKNKTGPYIYLIRDENAEHFRKYVKPYSEVHLINDKSNIPKSTWKCDLPKAGCLIDEYKDGFIAGREYASIKCYYGNRTCFGFEDQQKSHNFCSGPNTRLCPLNNDGFGFIKKVQVNGVERQFKCSPKHCTQKHLAEFILECDEAAQGGLTTGWTNVLGNETTEVDTITKIETVVGRRYCSLKNIRTYETEMIFEELIQSQVSF